MCWRIDIRLAEWNCSATLTSASNSANVCFEEKNLTYDTPLPPVRMGMDFAGATRPG